jgi:hypothetical protein
MAVQWPSLLKDDEGLQKDIEAHLTERVQGDPYSADGTFADGLMLLPVGLRAMAATHWLDISLTLDSITWHFLNFGEPKLVGCTEAGLLELGLSEMAECFRETSEFMQPLLANHEFTDFYDFLREHNLEEKAEELNRRAWDLDESAGKGKSVIYGAWVRYARQYPERVFGP